MENTSRNLQPFGLELDMDLRTPLDERAQAQFKALFYREKLLVFRNQHLTEADQVRVLGYIGPVLGSKGEYRELSSDGNLGAGPLCYHSDLSFTPEPFKVLSLHALEVVDGQSWTRFANGIRVLQSLPPELIERLQSMTAVSLISLVQTPPGNRVQRAILSAASRAAGDYSASSYRRTNSLYQRNADRADRRPGAGPKRKIAAGIVRIALRR